MKTSIFLLFLFQIYSVSLFADQWIQIPSIQFPLGHASTFTIGNAAFTGCGIRGSNASKEFWKFDNISETWTQIADLPSAERQNAFTFAVNGKGYVGCGNTLSGSGKDVWSYDTTLNSWTQVADFPDIRMYAVTFTIGDTGYVATGISGFVTRELWAYHPAANIWIRKADIPGPARINASGFSINGKGYAGMGTDSASHMLQDFYEYDPMSDSWTAKSSFGAGPFTHASGFVLNGAGYVTLGFDSTFNDFQTWAYFPIPDTWLRKADFPASPRVFTSSFSVQNNGYVCGGDTFTTGTGSVQGVGCWKYIPDTLDAINEYDDQNGFFFGPNPVSSTASMGMKNLQLISIYSEDGKLVFERKTLSEVIQIDCSGFSAGKYFLKASSKSFSMIHTFLKM